MKSCPGLADGSVWPGFYTLEGSSGGWEPWHSSGDITASFRLLGRAPVHLNTMCGNFDIALAAFGVARPPPVWEYGATPVA